MQPCWLTTVDWWVGRAGCGDRKYRARHHHDGRKRRGALWFADQPMPCGKDRAPEGSPCRDFFRAKDGHDQGAGTIARTQDRLNDVLAAIRLKAALGARILVVGYSLRLPDDGTVCSADDIAKGDYSYLILQQPGTPLATRTPLFKDPQPTSFLRCLIIRPKQAWFRRRT